MVIIKLTAIIHLHLNPGTSPLSAVSAIHVELIWTQYSRAGAATSLIRLMSQ